MPRTLLPLACAALVLLQAGPAAAHGPTVRVAWSGIRPPSLTVRAGTTVHFHNANASGSPCTVTADDGSFVGPTLARAEGWHRTFETAGHFAYHLSEQPSVRGRIVVVEP